MKGGPWCGAAYKKYPRVGVPGVVWHAYPWAIHRPWALGLIDEIKDLRNTVHQTAWDRCIRDYKVFLFQRETPPKYLCEIDWKNG